MTSRRIDRRKFLKVPAALATSAFTGIELAGAVGDGVADDTASLQAAHDTGKIVYYPPGKYRFSTLTIAKGGILGAGHETLLLSTDTGRGNIITFTGGGQTDGTPVFRDFNLSVPTRNAKPAGAAIFLSPDPPSNSMFFSDIENVIIRNVPTCLYFTNGSMFRVRNCVFFFYSEYGVYLDNAMDSDQGDSHIEGSQFFNGGSSQGAAIHQRSSGGLRITNNKFNAGAHAYLLDLEGDTSDFIFTGNSVENCAGAALSFSRSSGAAKWGGGVVITGNQFALNARDIQFDASGLWDLVTISGNTFRNYKGTDASVFIDIQSGRNVTICGNSLFASGHGQVGINIGPDVTHSRVGRNSYYGLRLAVANGSPATVLVDKDVVSGAVTIKTDASYKDYYIGTSTIVFPRKFETPPLVTANVGAGNSGGISVLLGKVTAVDATISVLGLAQGGLVPIIWRAEGMLHSF